MAFDPTNPPSLIAEGIGGARGLRAFAWNSPAPISEVISEGYVRTARKLGMREGDSVRYVDLNNGVHLLSVGYVDPDTGWGTLIFPNTDPAAFPVAQDVSFDQAYIVAYIDGIQKRVAASEVIGRLVPDATGTYAERDDYDDADPGFVFLSTSGGPDGDDVVYIMRDDNTWSEPIPVGRGDAGASAYEIALENGFVGTEVEWLASLDGTDGTDGEDGASAYQVALNNGFVGDQAAWLASLEGDIGDDGEKGWSPVLAVAIDGDRRVFQISDWTGGQGTKPATGQYIGVAGLTSTIADAVNVRGPEGAGPEDPFVLISTANFTTPAAAADFTGLDAYDEAYFVLSEIRHNSASGQLITLSISVDGATFPASTTIGSNIAAGQYYTRLKFAGITPKLDESICLNLLSNTSATVSTSPGTAGSTAANRVLLHTGGLKSIRFNLSAGANFNFGTISLYAR